MAIKTRKARQKKTITLAEFTAWLEGVEEMQPTDWTPDAPQWKLIKTKLKAIVPDEVQVQAPPVHAQHQPQQGGYQQPQFQPQGLPPGMRPPPEIPSSIPNGQLVADNSAGPPSMQPSMNASGEKVLKTPDVDGEYTNSQFG
jgi:hypothetical protein